MASGMITALLAEFWGTALIMFLTTAATTASYAAFFNSVNLFTAFFAYALCSFMFVKHSGAHFNPAITIAAVIARHIEAIPAVLYIVAQMIGSIVGVAIWQGIWANGSDINAKQIINNLISTAQDGEGPVFGLELMVTYFVVLVWFHVVDATRQPVGQYHMAWGPFVMGMAYFAALAASVELDVGCSNPARAFGVSVVAGEFQHHWIFWIGPMIGGIGAYLTFEFFNFVEKKTDAKITP